MSAKIFKDSDNIYQDQAKILFDFYSKAAEKIIAEEERIEEKIKKVETEKKILKLKLSGFLYQIWVFILRIFGKKTHLEKQIEEIENRIAEFQKMHKEIFRDYKITKLGIAYVPVAEQIKYGEKSFIVDYTGDVGDSKIEVQIPKNSELLSQSVNNLEKLSSQAPLVETSEEIEEISTDEYSRSIQHLNQHDYFGGLDRTLRTMAFCIGDLNTTSVELPLVETDGDYAAFLKEYATSEIPENAPIIKAFDNNKFKQGIETFKEINKLRETVSDKTAEFEDILKNLMMSVANSVQKISVMKISSTDKIVEESNRILFKILKSPYNHYSPNLEFDEIERIKNEDFNYGKENSDYQPFQLKESSKVRYDLFSDTWRSEDGSSVNTPFGVHQIYQEIVAPIVQNLMAETRKERFNVYNHIRDQKTNYLAQWHRDVEDFYGRNRAEAADLRNIMSESFRKFTAAYNTLVSLKDTEQSMSGGEVDLDAAIVKNKNNVVETLAGFQMQGEEFRAVQEDFDNYMSRLKDDIDEKAEKFGYVEYFDASLRDKTFKDMAVADSEKTLLEDRRKQLLAVDPLLAKESELPPVPSVEDLTIENIALNLPAIARNALNELLERDLEEKAVENKNTEEKIFCESEEFEEGKKDALELSKDGGEEESDCEIGNEDNEMRNKKEDNGKEETDYEINYKDDDEGEGK
jgi:hypothetical protein